MSACSKERLSQHDPGTCRDAVSSYPSRRSLPFAAAVERNRPVSSWETTASPITRHTHTSSRQKKYRINRWNRERLGSFWHFTGDTFPTIFREFRGEVRQTTRLDDRAIHAEQNRHYPIDRMTKTASNPAPMTTNTAPITNQRFFNSMTRSVPVVTCCSRSLAIVFSSRTNG
jgi:hypothetical protein